MAAPRRTLVWLAEAATLSADTLAACAGWLGPDERQRLARFVRAERRTQFLGGRVLLRRALSELLGVPPRAIELQERPGLGPALLLPAAPAVGFSISHSGNWIACAASTETALGLDIERIDPGRDVVRLAEQAFTPEQTARLAACEGAERIDLFYRLWCEHEASIKLASPVGKMYGVGRPGLCGALACATPLAADPVVEFASFA
ncbi:4'-phosphopantetheinyl transferase family protein [Massilia agri]|uniref:4'-phosphopantetheinyl transferase superfamily protein n=1 Tax=Massilia agri TaxID=1886785 RepID=A0ABT2ANV6_9BURK|nr:4'-phosphopantetheinyl transferase superfamily protein [Massilia agri]MCS0597917.1 4'-phosphopantetheinyl transferase superfamily protein [Massilia agri]